MKTNCNQNYLLLILVIRNNEKRYLKSLQNCALFYSLAINIMGSGLIVSAVDVVFVNLSVHCKVLNILIAKVK